MSCVIAVNGEPLEIHGWKDLLRHNLGQGVYQDWLQHLVFSTYEKGVLSLTVPSQFVLDWIARHYLDIIQSLMVNHIPTCKAVTLMLDRSVPASYGQLPLSLGEDENFVLPLGDGDQDIMSAPLDPRLTFSNFVVGKPNEFAYAAARRVAESDTPLYNPLFLYGPVGHGKTHLMHSIAHAITQESQGEKKILYLSAEKFMYYFIRALRSKNIMAFKERFRSVHVLMIDDVQFISGKDSTQEEFFHTFNALVDAQRQVVISADKSPSDLHGLQDRMKSRLGWGLAADLHPTTYELRLGILQSKAERHGMAIPKEILEFLASRVSSSVRELEGALNKVVAHASLVGCAMSLNLAYHALRDMLMPQAKSVSIEDIERRVCEHFHVHITDIHSSKRTRAISRPRQIAMFLAKNMTAFSLPMIGKHFGGRDHTTVLHAVNTVENFLKWDKNMREDLTHLRQSLENR